MVAIGQGVVDKGVVALRTITVVCEIEIKVAGV
jgi:hypothetical protein